MATNEGALYRFSHEAMATNFEVLVAGQQETYARQASLAVFREIDRLERLLSHFDSGSDVGQVSMLAPGESIRVSVDVYDCLKVARQVYEDTAGAFDVTVGPLYKCWKDEEGNAKTPTEEELAEAWARVGMNRVVLDDGVDKDLSDGGAGGTGPRTFSVAVKKSPDTAKGVGLDLGGIGKGFALEKAAEILEDWGIDSAVVHGGTSTVLAIGSGGEAAGCPPGKEGWPLGVGGEWSKGAGFERVLLRDWALSGSGKEMQGDHIIDLRTGRPAKAHVGAWACCPRAAEADALSTAFVVMSTAEVEAYCDKHPDVSAFLVEGGPNGPKVRLFGNWDMALR